MTQIENYTERVKRMVGRVLNSNGTTELLQGRNRLIGSEGLSDSERNALLQLCRMRLDAFRAQRGEEVYCFSSRRLRLRAPFPPPHADQRFDQVSGAHKSPGPLRVLRGRLLLGKPRTSGP